MLAFVLLALGPFLRRAVPSRPRQSVNDPACSSGCYASMGQSNSACESVADCYCNNYTYQYDFFSCVGQACSSIDALQTINYYAAQCNDNQIVVNPALWSVYETSISKVPVRSTGLPASSSDTITSTAGSSSPPTSANSSPSTDSTSADVPPSSSPADPPRASTTPSPSPAASSPSSDDTTSNVGPTDTANFGTTSPTANASLSTNSSSTPSGTAAGPSHSPSVSPSLSNGTAGRPATASVPAPTAGVPARSSSPGNLGAIIGGVVGGIVFCAAVIVLVWWFRRRGRISLAPATGIGAEKGGNPAETGATMPSLLRLYDPNDPTTYPTTGFDLRQPEYYASSTILGPSSSNIVTSPIQYASTDNLSVPNRMPTTPPPKAGIHTPTPQGQPIYSGLPEPATPSSFMAGGSPPPLSATSPFRSINSPPPPSVVSRFRAINSPPPPSILSTFRSVNSPPPAYRPRSTVTESNDGFYEDVDQVMSFVGHDV